eukprot:jgi/Undpi1/7673/HiC_scaffold_23.g10146.m1
MAHVRLESGLPSVQHGLVPQAHKTGKGALTKEVFKPERRSRPAPIFCTIKTISPRGLPPTAAGLPFRVLAAEREAAQIRFESGLPAAEQNIRFPEDTRHRTQR